MPNQRRSGPRIPLGLPARVRWRARGGSYREVQGTTKDISANGLFVRMPERVSQDTSITVTVILPTRIHTPIELHCQGRVMRSSHAGELQGIAAVIDDYELRPRQ